MARFTPSWTNTETTDWEAEDYFRWDKFRDQFGQNMEFLGQSHNHSGDAGDGAFIDASDPKYIWFIRSNGSPFA